ncbi:MAG: hypothetical protein ACE5HF_02710 [Gemmatimonadota bacterium]
MARTFFDADLLRWEAYVTGGQPDSAAAARIFFNCLDAPRTRPRFVIHPSGDVSVAERELQEATDEDLAELFAASVTDS